MCIRDRDHQVEGQPPGQARGLDHAWIPQELLQVAAHRPTVGSIRGPEVDQQHADAFGLVVSMDGRVHGQVRTAEMHGLYQAAVDDMCARHSCNTDGSAGEFVRRVCRALGQHLHTPEYAIGACLLYTSDAADDT